MSGAAKTAEKAEKAKPEAGSAPANGEEFALTNEPAATEPAESDAGGTRRMDPELRVMGQMLRMLEELPEPARGRVVAWLGDRYEQSRE